MDPLKEPFKDPDRSLKEPFKEPLEEPKLHIVERGLVRVLLRESIQEGLHTSQGRGLRFRV